MTTYRASRNNLGHLVIRDVPIFVECMRGEKTFDETWIDTAVAKAKLAEADGYLPPLHVRHHEATPVGDPARPAGFFRITRAAPLTFKGKVRKAIFADLIVTDPMVGEDVLKLRLPYRSVEIINIDEPAIDSLALLDHEAPYLQLPMLMVADAADQGTGAPLSPVALATFANPWASDLPETADSVVACFRAGKSARLFLEDPDDMTTTLPKKTPPAAGNGKSAKFADGEVAKPEGGEDEKPEGEEMAEGGLDVGAVCKAIRDGSITVADMEEIKAAIAEQLASVAAEATEEKTAEAPAMMPGGAMKADAGAKFAAMQAKLDAQDAKLAAMEHAATRTAAVDDALQRLAGRPLGADPAAKLAKRFDELGAAAFKVYVDDFAATFSAISGRATDGKAAAFGAMGANLPECVLAYTAQGADATEKAAKFAAEHAELTKHGATRHSVEAYVASNMLRAGFKAAK